MATRTITFDQVLTTITCYKCGIEFGVPEHWEQQRRRDHGDFYCPNGHSQAFFAETREEKLQKQLEEREQELREEANRARRAERKAMKLENDLLDKVKEHMSMEEKIHAGICPYCSRNFTNVRRHMRSKHLSEEAKLAEIASSKTA